MSCPIGKVYRHHFGDSGSRGAQTPSGSLLGVVRRPIQTRYRASQRAPERVSVGAGMGRSSPPRWRGSGDRLGPHDTTAQHVRPRHRGKRANRAITATMLRCRMLARLRCKKNRGLRVLWRNTRRPSQPPPTPPSHDKPWSVRSEIRRAPAFFARHLSIPYVAKVIVFKSTRTTP